MSKSIYNPIPDPSVSGICQSTLNAQTEGEESTSIYKEEKYVKDDISSIFSKISGPRIESLHSEFEKDTTKQKLYLIHPEETSEESFMKPTLRLERQGNIQDKLYNACLIGQLSVVKDILGEHYTSLKLFEYGQTPLFAACIGDQAEVAKYLIHHGFEVNHQDNEGKTPMHVAFEHRKSDIVQLLLNHNASYRIRDARNWTPFHVALDRGYYSLCSALLEKFFEEDVGTDVSWIQLHAACFEGDMQKVQFLLDTGVYVNHISSIEFTALMVACTQTNLIMVRYLLIHGADKLVNHVSCHGASAMVIACSKGNMDIVKCLLEHGGDPNVSGRKGRTLCHFAVLTDNIPLLQSLLNSSFVDLNAIDAEGSSCLHTAVIQGNVDAISLLLKHNIGVNCVNHMCHTALHIAIFKGEDAIAQILLANNADPDVKNAEGDTGLIIALHKRRETIAQMLLSAGAKVNVFDARGDTSLHLALHKNCSAQIVQLLVDHGAIINAVNHKHQTALVFAAHHGHTDALKVLLANGADPNIPDKDHDTVLHNAIRKNYNKETLQMIIKHGANLNAINAESQTPLMLTCMDDQTDAMKLLLDCGANPTITDEQGETCLHVAVHKHLGEETLQHIIDHSACLNDVNDKNQTALLLACIDQQMDSVKVLLTNGANPNIGGMNGDNCLHYAVNKQHLALVKVIVEYKINLNAKNDHNQTALYIACAKGYWDIASQLMKKGADLDIVNRKNNSPLHMAIKHNALDIAADLMIHGANVNIKGQHEMTPLHVAVNQGTDESVGLLLRHKADVNAQDNNGQTPLHAACKNSDSSKVNLLLQHPVNISCNNSDGHTAFDYSVIRCDRPTLEAFVNHDPAILNTIMGSGETALHYYCKKGNADMVNWMVECGADKDKICAQLSPVDAAWDNGHKNIVLMLIDAGADVSRSPEISCLGFVDRIYHQRHLHMSMLEHMIFSEECNIDLTAVNENHETLFFQACTEEAVEVIQILLDCKIGIGINVSNRFGKSPLTVVCESASKPGNESVTILSMLLQSQRAVDFDIHDLQRRTPLHITCQKDSLMMTNMLLRASKKSVNSQDSMGRTPLHFAKTAPFVKLLIDFGADPDVRDSLGQTALLYSCQQGNREVASALIKAKPRAINNYDHMSRTLVHLCTASRILDILKHTKHLKINMMDVKKQTALHTAVMSEDPECTQQLLLMGADPNVRDMNNLCPIHLASDDRCWKILKEHKASVTIRSVHGLSPDDMKQWHCELKAKHKMELWYEIAHKGHGALEKIIHMPLVGFIEEQHQEEYQLIQDQLKQFISRLSEEVQKIDDLMEFDVVSSGSNNEDTQVSMPDSAAFVCILNKVSEMLQPPHEFTFSKENVSLNLPSHFHGDQPHFVDCNGHVNAQFLWQHFSNVVQQALAVSDIWTEFSQFYRPVVDNLNDIRKVKLIWHGSMYKWLHISVDITPGLLFPDWQPSWCENRAVLQETQCCIMANCKGFMHAPEDTQPYLFQLNFFDAEAELFREMSPELKDGFKLAKLMRQPCICQPVVMEGQKVESASSYISSDMLKTVTFYLHDEQKAASDESYVSQSDFLLDSSSPIVFAQKIYEKLSNALKKNILGMYMIPTHNILHKHFQSMQDPTRGREIVQTYCQNIQNLLAINPKLATK